MPLLPFFAATTLVASSGRDVPPATIVSPITASLTPSCCATKVAESTNRLLPIINPAKPPIINRTDFNTLVFSNDSISPSSPLFAFFNVNKRKPKKVAKRMVASILLILPSKHNPSKSNDAKQAKGISFRTVPLRITMGVTAADTPTMSKELKILLPTTLPIARSGVPFIAETKLTKNSGIDVPAATIVKPITICDTFMR